MDKIKDLFELVDDELQDAMKYAKLAMEHKDTDNAMAELFYSLSLEEIKHKQNLYNCAVKAMTTYVEKYPEKEEITKEVFEALNERTIDWENSIRVYQGMYRE